MLSPSQAVASRFDHTRWIILHTFKVCCTFALVWVRNKIVPGCPPPRSTSCLTTTSSSRPSPTATFSIHNCKMQRNHLNDQTDCHTMATQHAWFVEFEPTTKRHFLFYLKQSRDFCGLFSEESDPSTGVWPLQRSVINSSMSWLEEPQRTGSWVPSGWSGAHHPLSPVTQVRLGLQNPRKKERKRFCYVAGSTGSLSGWVALIPLKCQKLPVCPWLLEVSFFQGFSQSANQV